MCAGALELGMFRVITERPWTPVFKLTEEVYAMSLIRGVFLVNAALSLLMFSPASPAQSSKPVGGLDCNGHSQIEKPLRPHDSCTDFCDQDDDRGYDNGHYVGHDEPSIGFISTVPHARHNAQW